jgi:hypothetical protein
MNWEFGVCLDVWTIPVTCLVRLCSPSQLVVRTEFLTSCYTGLASAEIVAPEGRHRQYH